MPSGQRRAKRAGEIWDFEDRVFYANPVEFSFRGSGERGHRFALTLHSFARAAQGCIFNIPLGYCLGLARYDLDMT